jgi:hypothetical protein
VNCPPILISFPLFLPRLINALEMLDTKRDKNPPKKHGNIPLLACFAADNKWNDHR